MAHGDVDKLFAAGFHELPRGMREKLARVMVDWLSRTVPELCRPANRMGTLSRLAEFVTALSWHPKMDVLQWRGTMHHVRVELYDRIEGHGISFSEAQAVYLHTIEVLTDADHSARAFMENQPKVATSDVPFPEGLEGAAAFRELVEKSAVELKDWQVASLAAKEKAAAARAVRAMTEVDQVVGELMRIDAAVW